MSLTLMECDKCIHSDVCFGKVLQIQFKEEICEPMEKYLDRMKKLLTASYDEWFRVYIDCKYFQKAGEQE